MERCHRVSALAILACALACPVLQAAETPSGGQPWTLEQCIRNAFENHGSALAAGESVAAARADVKGARSSLLYPTVSARGSRSEGRLEAQQSGSVPRRTGAISDEQYVLSADVMLFDGGTQRQSVRRARAGQTTAEASLERTRHGLALQVTTAYIRILRARHTLRVANQKMEQAQKQKTLVEGRIKAGAAAEVDIYPIEVQIASARVEQIRATNDVRVAASSLRNAMGLESGPSPEVEDLPEELQEPPPLDQCLEQALANRPETAQSVASIDRGRASLALAKLQTRPQILSSASWDRGFGASSITSQWTINAVLQWSLFDRGDRSAVDSASFGLRALEEDYRQVLKDIAAEVEQAHLALGSARERIEASRASIAMARKNLEVAEAKYKLGLAIPLEIVDAQVAYSNADLQAVEARYDYFLARAQLNRATGRDPLGAAGASRP